MGQIIIDVTLSVVACVAAFLMSLPFWRQHEYWAESQTMWQVYFSIGFILSVYVFFIFLRCLRTLFLHDAVEKGYQVNSQSQEKAGGK